MLIQTSWHKLAVMRLYFCSTKKYSHFAQPWHVHGGALCPDPCCVSLCPPQKAHHPNNALQTTALITAQLCRHALRRRKWRGVFDSLRLPTALDKQNKPRLVSGPPASLRQGHGHRYRHHYGHCPSVCPKMRLPAGFSVLDSSSKAWKHCNTLDRQTPVASGN